MLGYALGGLGLAALGAGAFFGLRTISKKSDAEGECSGRFCTQRGLDLYDDASSAAVASTVAFAVAAAALGAGAYLVFSKAEGSSGSKRPASTARRASPVWW